jgi:hypothetical protein
MNSVCWGINRGMPVLGWGGESDWAHHPATASDHLPWLWDRIALPVGLIVSVGDFFLATGVLLVLMGLGAGFALHRHGERLPVGWRHP